MDIRKGSLFFHFFVFIFMLVCHHHVATESTPLTEEWTQQQINGTRNICKDILGKKFWKNDIDKQIDENMAMFNVCVPKKKAFHEFVDVNDHDELIGGFSIAIFCLALQELPFKIQPLVFTLMDIDNYTEIVQKVESKDCDVVAGDFTITSDRTKLADFTLPYMSSEIYMLVPAVRIWSQTIVTLLKPFTPKLWMALLTACILTGVAIGFLEYREENPGFYHAPFYQKLSMVIWFPIAKFFFQEGRIYNRCSKVVLVVWLTTIFIVIQIFTAFLSSWLTVNQLQPKVPKDYHVVGYQDASFVVGAINDYIKNKSTVKKKIALDSLDDYKHALDNHTVDAIFDESPYIDIFLAKYKDVYMKVGPMAAEPGLAFAFPRGSPLRQIFSNAVVKVIESKNMTYMKKKYLRIETDLTTQPADQSVTQSLDVHSFLILFLFMGFTTIMAIIISEISRRRAGKNSIMPKEIHTISENINNDASMAS